MLVPPNRNTALPQGGAPHSLRNTVVIRSLTVVFSIAGYPRVIPEPEVTRRLAKHRYSQLRIAPNPRIIHPKDLETLESIERRSVFIPEHRNDDLDELDEDDFRRRYRFIKAPSRRL
ncbi:hypothetical protein TNCV_2077861 [Trichonephila clavipes]|nr:hypothetical protein TNCV_2077861 [Trichonephila clavipes]